ncbi:MAG: hypothetical protein ACREQW_00385 [Candidatus Binatia bacterium]
MFTTAAAVYTGEALSQYMDDGRESHVRGRASESGQDAYVTA